VIDDSVNYQPFNQFHSCLAISINQGGRMLPCLTPLHTLNGADTKFPHFTCIDWWAYQKAKILTRNLGTPLL